MWRLLSYFTGEKENGTTKYKDIISKSILKHPGPPAVYQVKPKKEIIGTLTRLTVGERNLNKTNRTILLVGETGSGKSALVDTLVNYTMGVKMEDEVWFQIVEEEEKESQAESQTSDVIVYDIVGYEKETLPFSLTIIDTPGFGDTRGPKHDEEVGERLLDWFGSKDGIHEINAVGLVMKTSDNRLNKQLLYILDSVMCLFGKNLEDKIVVLVTHSDGRKPENILRVLDKTRIKCAKKENQAIHFKFNNYQKEDQAEDSEYLKSLNNISERGFFEFKKFLEKSAPERLMTTTEVLQERKNLNACIQNLEERVKLIEQKQKETKQIQEALKQNEDKKNHVVSVDEVYKEKKPYPGDMLSFFSSKKVLSCTTCEENCHYPCRSRRQSCEIIRDGHCTVCTGKCPESSHDKENWIYVLNTRTTEKEIQHVTKTDSQINGSQSDNLENQLKQLTEEKTKLVDEAFEHFFKLQQIALHVNSRKTNRHLEFLIEKMNETGDTKKLRELEEIKYQLHKEARTALK